MTDHPIIFSEPMIRALLAGSKTMTRRLAWRWGDCVGLDGEDGLERLPTFWQKVEPGALLWVREAFAVHHRAEARIYAKGDGHPWGSPLYRATFLGGLLPECEGFTKWRSPIFMPRWASRITLAVTAVKVERLQDISEEDAKAEGVGTDLWDMAPVTRDYRTSVGWFQGWSPDAGATYVDECRLHRASFETLWNSLHGKLSWKENPWVVVVRFERIDA